VSPRRLLPIAVTLLVAALLAGLWTLRHMHDDVRRLASRLMGCPADNIEVEALDGGDVERYRVKGCGGGGIMSCEPSDPVCFIVPEEP
jgi:hypothetical protein